MHFGIEIPGDSAEYFLSGLGLTMLESLKRDRNYSAGCEEDPHDRNLGGEEGEIVISVDFDKTFVTALCHFDVVSPRTKGACARGGYPCEEINEHVRHDLPCFFR